MDIEFLYRIFSRLLFFGALIMLGVASVELVFNLFSYSFIHVIPGGISAGRLIEMAAAFVVFVIAVLLRQIRDAQKSL